jgi:hypothetical protein
MIPCKVEWHHSALLVTFVDGSDVLLQVDSDKAAFCASCGTYPAFDSWHGISPIMTEWDPTEIFQCPDDYLEVAEMPSIHES